jgi:hypothetical protein
MPLWGGVCISRALIALVSGTKAGILVTMNRRLLIGFLLLPIACTSSGGKVNVSGAAGSSASGAAGSGSGAAGTGASTAGTTGTAGNGTAGNGTAGTTGTAGNGTAGTGVSTAGTTGTAGVGTAGASGAAGSGTAGAAGAGTAGTGAVDTSASVLERNKHPSRDGAFVQPKITKAMAAKMAPDTAFNTAAVFPGNMWASPLYLANGPNNKGVFFAVTASNMVYAFDETTGAIVWMHSIGSASQSTGAGCGEGPIGISGTPIIDATARTIYVAGGIGTNGVMRHEVHALSVDDGTEKTGWPVNLSGMQSGGQTFNPAVENQRGSLSLVNGILYVPYGGYNGDCGGYHGWVFAINTKTPTSVGAWATGGQGEAIWASGGMASDGTNVFLTTGNSTNGTANHADSEEIVRLTGMATLDRTTGVFYPSDWRNMDGGDADLGASSPVYFELPNSTPSTLVAAVAKNGSFYVVNSKNLGGMAGSVISYKATNSAANGGNSVRTAMATYQTPMGRYVVFNGGAPICPKGDGPIMSILFTPGTPPKAATAFCTPGGTNTSPITTSTDGTNDVVIWYMSGGKLTGADGDTGAMIYSGGNCGNVRRWTSPIAVNGRIVVAGDGHLCSWSIQP